MGSDIKRKQMLIKEYAAARVLIYQKTKKKTHSREEKASEKKLKKREFQPRRIIQRRERERELELKNILGWSQRNPDPAELALLLLA